MNTLTTDHTEPRQEGCQCTDGRYCPRCYAARLRAETDRQMRDWLRWWDANGSGPR